MGICIRIDKLTKCYGSKVAVNGLSLDINEGEVFGLLGPNGAGKSTTLYMLTGLVRPTSGSISIFGKDLRKNFLQISARMGVAVERPAFYDHLSVKTNLQIQSRLIGKTVTIDRTLDLLGLLGHENARPSDLSMGMRQRLSLAQAFLTEPELLILDEPTSGLDTEVGQEIGLLLRRLAEEASVTIILTSHMMQEVESLCDRVAIINEGKLVSWDETDSLISYDKSTVEVLIDSPEAAARRLTEEPWVESVETRPGRLLVRLKNENPHQLNAFLLGAGYQISGIIPRRRSLQEYFLKALNR